MRRVLVTGATGFIGRHALPLLAARDYEVHAVTSRVPPHSTSGAVWHRGDLMDRAAVDDVVSSVRPSHLLHFAWYTEHRRFWTAPVNLRWLQASLDVVHAFEASGGRRVVMSGTCAEYGRTDGPCHEHETPLVPETLYGVCKHALQLVTTAFANQTQLSSAWGRIFHLYGPGEPPERLVPSVIRALLIGEPARCSHGDQVRDFLAVEDVAGAFVALLDSDVTGPVNIGAGVPITVGGIVEEIGRHLGRPDLIRLGAVDAPLGEPAVLVPDTSRLATEVGWRPTLSLQDGLAKSIDWWRAALAAGAARRT